MDIQTIYIKLKEKLNKMPDRCGDRGECSEDCRKCELTNILNDVSNVLRQAYYDFED